VRVRPDALSHGVRTASALAPSRLAVNRVLEVADPRSLDDAKLLEADLSRVKAVEEPNPVPRMTGDRWIWISSSSLASRACLAMLARKIR
jgi:hypothetical protein